jgi:hypothetical protein
MASTGKKKTTMAKLARESRLRERRLEKEARKEARSRPRRMRRSHRTAFNREPAIGRSHRYRRLRLGQLLDRAVKSREPEASPHTRD